jgi:hypothetical protein
MTGKIARTVISPEEESSVQTYADLEEIYLEEAGVAYTLVPHGPHGQNRDELDVELYIGHIPTYKYYVDTTTISLYSDIVEATAQFVASALFDYEPTPEDFEFEPMFD